MKWPSTCLQWYLLLWNLFSLLLIQPLHLLMLTVCMEYILPSLLLLVIYVFIFKACVLLTASNWVLDFKSSFNNLCLLIGILVYFHLIIDMVVLRSSLLRFVFCLVSFFLYSFPVLFCFNQIFLLFHFHFFLGILALYFCTFKSCCSRDYICILNLD